MSPHVAPFTRRCFLAGFTIGFAVVVASCATAAGEDAADAGRADARVRADASPEDPRADASAGRADASTSSPDASLTPDAAPRPLGDTLLITEIVDADLPGGLPKFVEITNLGAVAVDLSDYSLGIFNNGSFTLNNGVSSTPLGGTLAAAASYVISFETGDTLGNSSFRTVYGIDADDLSFDAVISGNDVVILFRGVATGTGADATVVDTYGVRGTDGVGEVWEYTDGFASRRQSVTVASDTFAPSEWDFSGPGALESVDAAGVAAATSPGTH